MTTLGQLVLHPDGFARPKPLVVLAYLALEGTASRSRLQELFFAKTVDPGDSLSTTLRRLKRLPCGLEAQGNDVSAAVTCDAAEVLELLDTSDLKGACQAYAGRFLDDLSLDLPVEGEEWVFAAREFIAKRVIDAHLSLGEGDLRDGDEGLARGHASSAYHIAQAEDLEPAVLARLYYLMQRSGHPNADNVLAIVRSDGLNARWGGGMGQIPDARLGPVRPTPLISREAELEAVVQAVTAIESRLISVHGTGGIGKTRLVQEVIRAAPLELAFGAERYFVALENVSSSGLLPSAIAKAIDLHRLPGSDTWSGLASAIGSSRRLVVLDAWEHLAEATPRLIELLELCTGLQLVVTTRERLGVPQESALTLSALELPPAEVSPAAREAAALQMFVQQARRYALDFVLADEDLAAAARVCHAVGGLPLGLALAAAWTRGMTMSELATTLESDVTALGSTSTGASPRHATLGGVVEASWVTLDEHHRSVLRKLSVCHGFRREAASSIAGAEISDLVSLSDRSWLTVSPAGRFSMHAVLRRYAELELAGDELESASARAAQRRHYTGLLLQKLVAGSDTPSGLSEALRDEESNFAACFESAAADGDAGSLALLVGPLRWYFATAQGRFRDGDALFSRVAARIDKADESFRDVLTQLLTARAWFCRYAGNIAEALEHGRQAVALAESGGTSASRANAHEVLGQVHMLTGNNTDALAHLETGYEIATAMDDHDLRLRAMEKIVHVRTALGDFNGAAEVVTEALRIVDTGLVAPSMDVVAIRFAVGFHELAKKDWLSARDGFARGLALTKRHGFAGPEPLFRVGLGMAEVGSGTAAGDDELVANSVAESAAGLEQAEQSGESLGIIFARGSLARAALYRGDLVDAETQLHEGLRTAWDLANRTAAMWIAPWLVELRVRQGLVGEAAELATAICRESATPAWVKQHLSALQLDDPPDGRVVEVDEFMERYFGGHS